MKGREGRLKRNQSKEYNGYRCPPIRFEANGVVAIWICYRGGFAFVRLNIAVEKNTRPIVLVCIRTGDENDQALQEQKGRYHIPRDRFLSLNVLVWENYRIQAVYGSLAMCLAYRCFIRVGHIGSLFFLHNSCNPPEFV